MQSEVITREQYEHARNIVKLYESQKVEDKILVVINDNAPDTHWYYYHKNSEVFEVRQSTWGDFYNDTVGFHSEEPRSVYVVKNHKDYGGNLIKKDHCTVVNR